MQLIIIAILILKIVQNRPAYFNLLSHQNEPTFIEFQINNSENQNKQKNSQRVPDKDLNKNIDQDDYKTTDRNVITAKIIAHQNDDFQFFYNEKLFLRYNNSINALKSDFNLNVLGDLELNSAQDQFIFEQTPVWKLYKHEDFQDDRSGWSKDSASNCKTNENLFLGGYCNFGGLEVSKTYDNLPVHSKIMVTFSFHFIDEWTGEYGYAKMDDKYIWVQNHQWCDKILPWFCKKYGINVCGNDYPDYLSKFVSYSTKHTASKLTLSFGSSLQKNPCQASWGLDDVQIFFI